jgi:hypothetical protein
MAMNAVPVVLVGGGEAGLLGAGEPNCERHAMATECGEQPDSPARPELPSHATGAPR